MADIAPEITSTLHVPQKEVAINSNLRERLVNELRVEMKLPPPPEPEPLVDLAAFATRQAIVGGGIADIFMNLKRKSTQSFFVAAATVLGRADIPRMPEEMRKSLETPKTPWERYREFFLNGNQDVLYATTDEELAEWRRKSRFFQTITVKEVPVSSEELQNDIFQTFRETDQHGNENLNAPEWDIEGRKKHSYELEINNKDDVKIIDIHDANTWKVLANANLSEFVQFQNKLIVIRRHNGEWNGNWEQEVVSNLLDVNKAVLYVVDPDERRGTGGYMQMIINHNWADAKQIDHGLTRLTNEFMGGNREADNREMDKILYQCNTRFNFGENAADGAVKTFIPTGREKALINELYLNYASQIKNLVDKYNVENPNNKKDLFLTNATFLQLLLLEVTEGKGGVLKFDKAKKLDHFEVKGSLKELEEAIGNRNLDAVEFILSLDHPDKSTMSLIGEADNQLRTPEEKYKMAVATWRSGAARGISGTTMLSVLREGKDSKSVGCPACPPFMETAQTANVRLSKLKDNDGFRLFDRIIINIKALWTKKV